jgi:prepilin peptidase CpaA
VILSTVALLIFPLLMAFAGSSDLLTMRISNRIVLMLVAGFFIVALVAGLSPEQIAMHMVIAVAVLAVGFAFFAFGWVGGGDAKFAAATALWIGLGTLLPYLIYAALLGGALTLAVLVVRRWRLPALLARVKWIDRLHDSKSGVPYGIALAVAGILVYAQTPIFLAIFRQLVA